MDEMEYDIYGDLDDFNLGEQVKEVCQLSLKQRKRYVIVPWKILLFQKSTLISNLEEKLRLAEEAIAALEQKNKNLCVEKETLEKNMSSLMKTAKAELSRKLNQIEELRRE